MNAATFVLSTGRCGTQWLAKNLTDHYGDLLAVTHEPHQREYLPRRCWESTTRRNGRA
jgi:hypothetical protein